MVYKLLSNKIMSKKISIIGVGYVGLPLAIKLSKKNKVIGYDSSKIRIYDLKNKNDIYKDQILKKNKNLKFSNDVNDIKNSDLFIITVPTPVDNKNKPNLRYLKEASKIVWRVYHPKSAEESWMYRRGMCSNFRKKFKIKIPQRFFLCLFTRKNQRGRQAT